jgi:hypothetical protein
MAEAHGSAAPNRGQVFAVITPADRLRNAIQKLLNAEGDGFIVDQFVLALGLQRIDSDGKVQSTAWVWAPAEQPDWQTDGLLRAASELREISDIDTD